MKDSEEIDKLFRNAMLRLQLAGCGIILDSHQADTVMNAMKSLNNFERHTDIASINKIIGEISDSRKAQLAGHIKSVVVNVNVLFASYIEKHPDATKEELKNIALKAKEMHEAMIEVVKDDIEQTQRKLNEGFEMLLNSKIYQHEDERCTVIKKGDSSPYSKSE